MNEYKIDIETALKYLKAGYRLTTIEKNKEKIFYKDGEISIYSENKFFVLSIYDFLSLYQNSFFLIDENNSQEEVDIEKDKEYYSWKQ